MIACGGGDYGAPPEVTKLSVDDEGGRERCHVATATCGCVEDADCPDGDICHEGRCRCTVARGCGVFFSPDNPGTRLECIPL